MSIVKQDDELLVYDLTVATVCFNAISTLPRCIQSVQPLYQSGLKVEHLFIDGASIDGTVAYLEEQLAQAQAAIGHEAELETYRRAERAERAARERARQVYIQANAVLADATTQADAAAAQIGAIADQVTAQLQQYQEAISQTKQGFSDAVATLYAIRPEEE